MNHFKKAALAGAIGALMLSAGAAQAHVSYHVSLTGGEAPNTNGSIADPAKGYWTDGAPTAPGFNLPATWLAAVHSYNHNYEVSANDAITNHGAGSAFVLQSVNNKWKPTSSWGNALDYGLIDLDVAGDLTITVAADTALNSTFAPGFTL